MTKIKLKIEHDNWVLLTGLLEFLYKNIPVEDIRNLSGRELIERLYFKMAQRQLRHFGAVRLTMDLPTAIVLNEFVLPFFSTIGEYEATLSQRYREELAHQFEHLVHINRKY
jgi:hypothetical protein